VISWSGTAIMNKNHASTTVRKKRNKTRVVVQSNVETAEASVILFLNQIAENTSARIETTGVGTMNTRQRPPISAYSESRMKYITAATK
jgi:hypothetical protein